MNIKKIIGFSLVGLAVSFAQESAPVVANDQNPAQETALTELQSASTAPAVAPSAPVQEAPAQVAPESAAPEVSAEAAASETAVSEPVSPVEPVLAPEAAQAQEPAAEPTTVEPVAAAPAAPEVTPVEPAPQAPAEASAVEAAPQAVASAESTPVQVKTEAAPAAPRGPGFTPRPKTKFDVLHGNAYNRQRNVAAANSIDLLLRYPNLFANQKFLYIEPSDEMGVVSFGNLFSAVDVSGDVGRLTLGYAQLGFGFYLKAGVGQVNFKNDNVERHATSVGDDLGLAVSKTIVGYNIGLTVDWLTFNDEITLEPKHGVKTEQNYRDLTANLSVTNAPRADRLFWTVGVQFVNELNELREGGGVIPDSSDSYMQATPVVRLDYIGLQNEHARVFAGMGLMVPLTFHEKYTFEVDNRDYTRSNNEYAVVLEPHVMGEVFLTKNVMFFGEASYQWVAVSSQKAKDFDGAKTDVLVSQMNKVDASLGARWQYNDFIACEFALGDRLFTDTKASFDGEGVFASFGGFIYF